MSEYKHPDTSPIEMGLLRTAMQSEQTHKVMHMLTSQLFSMHSTKTLFRAIRNLSSRNVVLMPDTLAVELSSSFEMDDTLASSYIDSLWAAEPVSDPSHFVRHLSKMRVRQESVALGQWLSSREGATADPEAVTAKINAFSRMQYMVGPDKANDLTGAINQIIEGRRSQRVISPGMHPLDTRMRIKESTFTIIGADSGCGKTSFMLNMAVNNALQDIPSAVISIEMTDFELADRILGILSGVDTDRISENNLTDHERQTLRHYATKHAKAISLIKVLSPEKLHVERIHGIMQNLVSAYGIQVMFIDYVQRLKASDKLIHGTTDRVAFVSETLTEVAKFSGIPIVALSQLARDRGTTEKGMAHLKHSAQLEHDAHNICILSEFEKRDPNADSRIVAIDGLKNRGGKLFKEALLFDLPSQRFTHSGYSIEQAKNKASDEGDSSPF